MAFPKHMTGQLLARLVPGFDGVYDATKDEIIWKDQRQLPSKADLDLEYQALQNEKVLSDEKKSEKEDGVEFLKGLDTSKALQASDLDQAVRILIDHLLY